MRTGSHIQMASWLATFSRIRCLHLLQQAFVLPQLFLVNIHHTRDTAGSAAFVRLWFTRRLRQEGRGGRDGLSVYGAHTKSRKNFHNFTGPHGRWMQACKYKGFAPKRLSKFLPERLPKRLTERPNERLPKRCRSRRLVTHAQTTPVTGSFFDKRLFAFLTDRR